MLLAVHCSPQSRQLYLMRGPILRVQFFFRHSLSMLRSAVFMTSTTVASLLLCCSTFANCLPGSPKASHGAVCLLTLSHIFGHINPLPIHLFGSVRILSSTPLTFLALSLHPPLDLHQNPLVARFAAIGTFVLAPGHSVYFSTSVCSVRGIILLKSAHIAPLLLLPTLLLLLPLDVLLQALLPLALLLVLALLLPGN